MGGAIRSKEILKIFEKPLYKTAKMGYNIVTGRV